MGGLGGHVTVDHFYQDPKSPNSFTGKVKETFPKGSFVRGFDFQFDPEVGIHNMKEWNTNSLAVMVDPVVLDDLRKLLR